MIFELIFLGLLWFQKPLIARNKSTRDSFPLCNALLRWGHDQYQPSRILHWFQGTQISSLATELYSRRMLWGSRFPRHHCLFDLMGLKDKHNIALLMRKGETQLKYKDFFHIVLPGCASTVMMAASVSADSSLKRKDFFLVIKPPAAHLLCN